MIWLGELFLGLGVPERFVKLASYGLIVALIVLVLALGRCAYNDHNRNEQNQGAQTEQLKSQSETINAVASAQNVVAHPTSDQLNVVCSKYDRNCPHGS